MDYGSRETVYGSERALNYESGESLGTAGNITNCTKKMIYYITLYSATEKKTVKIKLSNTTVVNVHTRQGRKEKRRNK